MYGTRFHFSGTALEACFFSDGTSGDYLLRTGIEDCQIMVEEAGGGGGCAEYGIDVLNSSTFTIRNVEVVGANTYGVKLQNSGATGAIQIENLRVLGYSKTDVGLWAYTATLQASGVYCESCSGAGVYLLGCSGTMTGLSISGAERWGAILSQCNMSVDGLTVTQTNAEYAGIIGAEACTLDHVSLLYSGTSTPETPSRAMLLTAPTRVLGAIVKCNGCVAWATANVNTTYSSGQKYWVDGQGQDGDGYCDLVVTNNDESQDTDEFYPS
jgi:hypothetical protein